MNFLEELTAEWYEYKGYLVRKNVKFGRRPRGGWIGEIDVVAFDPQKRLLTHIETSTDSDVWTDREQRFQRKFRDAREHYLKLFPYKGKFQQIAIVGFTRIRAGVNFGLGVQIKSIPEFMKELVAEFSRKDPRRDAVPEAFPLLRAVQYSAFFSIRNL